MGRWAVVVSARRVIARRRCPMATCKSCGAPVVWAVTPRGKRTPLDAVTSPDGNVELLPDGSVRVLGPLDAEAARLAGAELYLSHFATCPAAAAHRRRR